MGLPYQEMLSQPRTSPESPPLTNPDRYHVDAEDLVCTLGGKRDL